MKRAMIITALAILALLIIGEVVAKFWLGLGEPPLFVADPDIDYLNAPNQNCDRFGGKIIFNNYSMRTVADISLSSPSNRIFVVGDSIVYGTMLLSQEQLATTILQEKLGGGGLVCNVSAGSWGPGNYAAYFRKYPELLTMNSVMYIVVSSHDLWEDDPSVGRGNLVGLSRSMPATPPYCALTEGISRYAWPIVKSWFVKPSVNRKVDVNLTAKDGAGDRMRWNLQQMDYLYALPIARKVLILHRTQQETMKGVEPEGERGFRENAVSNHIEVISWNLNAQEDYLDAIHTNASGQRKLADVIEADLRSSGYIKEMSK